MAVFVTGTTTLFKQSTAPLGWTKVPSDYTNYTLRLVNGTGGGIGGSVDFTTVHTNKPLAGPVNVSGSVSPFTLTVGYLPPHPHTVTNAFPGEAIYRASPGTGPVNASTFSGTSATPGYTGYTSFSTQPTMTAHTHPVGGAELNLSLNSSVPFDVAYIDCIIASRD